MFECRIKKDKFPKEGEIVIGKIASIQDDVLTMNLLEYGDISGLILTGELSKKKIKSIAQLTKVGNIEVCQVLKVEQDRGFIDLSLKRVSEEDKKTCKENFAKSKLTYQMVYKACKAADVSIKDVYENWAYKKEEEWGSLFAFFVHAKNNPEVLENEPHGAFYKNLIEEQFKASTFKVRAEVDIICIKGGIKAIKEIFNRAYELDKELEITLTKSPTYSIVKIGDNKDESFDIVNRACQVVKEATEEHKGTFSVVSPAKLYGEKARHTILDTKEVEQDRASSDEESDD